MKTLFDFSTGSLSSFGLLLSIDKTSFIESSNIDRLINFFIALIVGVVSTIVLNILRAKFPKLFNPLSGFKKDNSQDNPRMR